MIKSIPVQEISEEFLNSLHERIDMIRPHAALDERHIAGYRFKNTEICGKAVVGAVLVANMDPPLKDVLTTKEAVGLKLDKSLVESAAYDALIFLVLRQVSFLDYQAENKVEYN